METNADDGGTSIMTQMEQEMDDLQQMHYSTEYSTHINTKMQMPSRLSMATPAADMENYRDTTSRDFDSEFNNITNSPAHAMNVPERIMVAGSDTHVGMRHMPRHLDIEELSPFPTADTVVGLTTPPHTLKMEDVRFPTVGDQSVMKANRQSANQQTVSNMNETPAGRAKHLINNSLDGGPVMEMQVLQHHLLLLRRKVAVLEDTNIHRDRREVLFCTLGAIYLVYKGIRLLTRIL